MTDNVDVGKNSLVPSERTSLISGNDLRRNRVTIHLPEFIVGERSFPRVAIHISRVALPIALSFTFSFEVACSGVLMGHMSNDPEFTAAITLVSTIMNSVCLAGVAPLFALPVYLSPSMSALEKYLKSDSADEDEVRLKRHTISALYRSGMLLAAVMTPAMMATLFFSEEIATHVFQQNAEVAGIAAEYLRPYAFAVPGFMARMLFEQLILTSGNAVPAMLMGLSTFTVGTLISMGLGFGFSFKNITVPAMGPMGVAIGYGIEAYLIAALYGGYLKLNPFTRQFNMFKIWGLDKKATKGIMSKVTSLSLPISFSIVNELLVSFIIGALAGAIGADSQAAMSYMMQYIFFSFILVAAFGVSVQQEIGRAIGAENYSYAQSFARKSLLTTLLWVGTPTIAVGAYPKILTYIMGSSTPSINHTMQFLTSIMAVGVFCDIGRYTMLQQLRALSDTWLSTAISAVGLFLSMIMSAGLGLFTDLGVYGVGIGYSIGIALTMLAVASRWVFKTKESHIEVVNEKHNSSTSIVSSVTNFVGSFFSGRKNVDRHSINLDSGDESRYSLDQLGLESGRLGYDMV